MSSQVVDKLVMELELELKKFRTQAQEAERLQSRLRKSLKDTEDAGEAANESNKRLGDSTEDVGKKAGEASVSLLAMAGRLKGLFATVTSSFALERLATGIAKVNDNLYFMQQRLGMGAEGITKLSNAAAMLGGDAQGMSNTIRGLNQSIQQLVMMGDASALPFFNALGVGVTDAQGKVRDMDAILLDMADSFSSMDPRQAYALASAMGLDDGVANALIQGRDAMQEMLDLQKDLYVSTQQELAASRELRKNQALLGAQWTSIKTMLGNALIPLFTRLTKGAQEFTEYLMRNERTVKNVFEGLTYVVGALTVAAFGKAIIAAAAFLSPLKLVAAGVLAVSGAFIALYDDYKTWAAGGKSLFDWTAFDKYIKEANFSVENLSSAFVRLFTGYNTLGEAVGAFTNWAKLKGFLDESGLSVNSLATGFKNLAVDIFNSIPLLRHFASMVEKIMKGDFAGALSDAGDMAASLGRSAYGETVAVSEHIAGAVDTAAGIDPSQSGSAAGLVRSIGAWGMRLLGGGDDPEAIMRQEEARVGLPPGTLSSIRTQETGDNPEYMNDPAKYHYGLNADGKRIAGHTGKVSTAFGPFGILESTGANPGYGVSPLANKSFAEQARFAADYLAARSARAGGLEAGLAGYGEGAGYARQVMSRIPAQTADSSFNPVEWVRRLTPNTTAAIAAQGGSQQTDINVNVGGVTVHTSASTLPEITSDALGAAVAKSENTLNQLASGL